MYAKLQDLDVELPCLVPPAAARWQHCSLALGIFLCSLNPLTQQ